MQRSAALVASMLAAEEEASAYWESPINSHVFDVPRKTNVAVDGVPPGRATSGLVVSGVWKGLFTFSSTRSGWFAGRTLPAGFQAKGLFPA